MELTDRRYFILDRPSDSELEALEACIGLLWTQRYSLDGTQILIKTNQYIIDNWFNSAVSKFGKEYTNLKELKGILASLDWQIEDLI